jgi:hypothetical protein
MEESLPDDETRKAIRELCFIVQRLAYQTDCSLQIKEAIISQARLLALSLEKKELNNFKVGDRVAVYDEGLVALAKVMAQYEPNAKAQNEGIIESIHDDGTAIIIFDAGDAAPYPLSDCTLI